MPFDMNAVMSDPQFQLGLGLMGAASPRNRAMLDAYQMLQQQEQRKMAYAKQQADIQNQQSEIGLRQAQVEQSKVQNEQTGARTKVYEQDVAMKQRQMEIQQKQAEDAMGFLKSLGIGGPAMQPQSAPATGIGGPQQTQAPASNLFGKADSFVANVEGGYVANDGGKGPTNYGINQRANPDVNVKALTPDAASAIRKQRYWDAIGADNLPPQTAMVAYDAAVNQGQQYAKNLLEKTGGDPMLMIYQRRQDYQNLAKNPMQAANLKGWEGRLNGLEQQLKTADTQPTQAAPKTGLDPARAMQMAGGMINLTSDPAAGLTTIGKALEPTQVSPGSFTRDAYGNMTQVPDPKGQAQMQAEQARLGMESQRVAMERQKTAMEQSRTERTNAEGALKLKKEQASDFGQVTSVIDASKTSNDAIQNLLKSPGLNHITGSYSSLPDAVRKVIDPQGMNAKADLDALGSKVLLSQIQTLKSLSQNGSTGFGQLSNVEGAHLINSIASMQQAQTTDQLKERLVTVAKSVNSSTDRAIEVYEKTHDQSPYQGLPVGTRPLRDATGGQKVSKNGHPLLVQPDGKLIEARQ